MCFSNLYGKFTVFKGDLKVQERLSSPSDIYIYINNTIQQKTRQSDREGSSSVSEQKIRQLLRSLK